MVSFTPLHNYVLIKRMESEAKTSGGIFIPDTATKEKPTDGEVIAVGKGSRNDKGELIALEVKVGDIVVFGKWSGTEIKLGEDTFIVLKENEILGIKHGNNAAHKAA